jgi:hypothetical protein
MTFDPAIFVLTFLLLSLIWSCQIEKMYRVYWRSVLLRRDYQMYQVRTVLAVWRWRNAPLDIHRD